MTPPRANVRRSFRRALRDSGSALRANINNCARSWKLRRRESASVTNKNGKGCWNPSAKNALF